MKQNKQHHTNVNFCKKSCQTTLQRACIFGHPDTCVNGQSRQQLELMSESNDISLEVDTH